MVIVGRVCKLGPVILEQRGSIIEKNKKNLKML